MIYKNIEEGILYAKCEYCGRILKFDELSLRRVYGKDFDRLAFPEMLQCFCGEEYEMIDKVPKLPYNSEMEEEEIALAEPWKDYFGKIQCYEPTRMNIDCPVKVLEVSILKDTTEDDILLRLRMWNQEKKDLVAIFVSIDMEDILGNKIKTAGGEDKMFYIYQDILIHPGDRFGEKMAVKLPKSVRRVSISVEKVAFLDGTLWVSSSKNLADIKKQEMIKLPADYNARFISVLNEDFKRFAKDIKLVCFYYEENDKVWQCTCGRTNAKTDETCSFCGLERSYVQKVLSKASVAKKLNEYMEEKQELAMSREQASYELAERKKNKKRILTAGGGAAVVAFIVWFIISFF